MRRFSRLTLFNATDGINKILNRHRIICALEKKGGEGVQFTDTNHFTLGVEK